MSEYDGLAHRLWYGCWRGLCQIVAITAFGIRSFGREKVPTQGGALLASNHQSFLDPMVVGLCLWREVHYLARDSLFRQRAFAWLIRSVNAFPVKRDTVDLAAIKESLRRLKDDQLLLLFGEGTRTHDGRIAPLQPGMAMMARKAKVPLIPVVIDGAFEAWPRSRKLWRFCTIRVMFGQPITAQQIADLGDKAAAQIIFQRQQEMQHRLRRRYGRKPYSYLPVEDYL
ncbi:MAG: 1-acyl-sn-glycerol-3-phosphate acyltransferase [Phycisphaerae bacterium]|nr:1-acyl-sn-glycerol-3-phosphate acyltransferase [Phycisphaerae bacterium]